MNLLQAKEEASRREDLAADYEKNAQGALRPFVRMTMEAAAMSEREWARFYRELAADMQMRITDRGCEGC